MRVLFFSGKVFKKPKKQNNSPIPTKDLKKITSDLSSVTSDCTEFLCNLIDDINIEPDSESEIIKQAIERQEKFEKTLFPDGDSDHDPILPLLPLGPRKKAFRLRKPNKFFVHKRKMAIAQMEMATEPYEYDFAHFSDEKAKFVSLALEVNVPQNFLDWFMNTYAIDTIEDFAPTTLEDLEAIFAASGINTLAANETQKGKIAFEKCSQGQNKHF